MFLFSNRRVIMYTKRDAHRAHFRYTLTVKEGLERAIGYTAALLHPV